MSKLMRPLCALFAPMAYAGLTAGHWHEPFLAAWYCLLLAHALEELLRRKR